MNKTDLVKELMSVVGAGAILHGYRDLLAYEYDASLARHLPDAVVFAESTSAVSRILRFAHTNKIPIVARGAGTNLSGGTVALQGGIVLEMSRMNRILSIDTENQRAVVQPGVVNLELQNALAPLGYFFAPDPASQKCSTLGGNAGENSGGPHCLSMVDDQSHTGHGSGLDDGPLVSRQYLAVPGLISPA